MKGSRCILLVSALLLLLLPLLSAAVQKSQPADEPGTAITAPADTADVKLTPFQDRTPRYQLRPGDIFDLNFEFNPEFNQTISIQPDGFVTLKGLGDVQIANRSVPDATQLLTTMYGKFISKPNLILVLKDFEKPYFIASGQLARPGKYELRGDTTVSEGINIAGGFLPTSKHSQVVLFRKVSDQWMEAKELDMKKMLASRDLREDLHLRPGDMIYVPQNKLSKIRSVFPVNPAVVFNPSQVGW